MREYTVEKRNIFSGMTTKTSITSLSQEHALSAQLRADRKTEKLSEKPAAPAGHQYWTDTNKNGDVTAHTTAFTYQAREAA